MEPQPEQQDANSGGPLASKPVQRAVHREPEDPKRPGTRGKRKGPKLSKQPKKRPNPTGPSRPIPVDDLDDPGSSDEGEYFTLQAEPDPDVPKYVDLPQYTEEEMSKLRASYWEMVAGHRKRKRGSQIVLTDFDAEFEPTSKAQNASVLTSAEDRVLDNSLEIVRSINESKADPTYEEDIMSILGEKFSYLAPHQVSYAKSMVKLAINHRVTTLASSMGSGKTITALAACTVLSRLKPKGSDTWAPPEVIILGVSEHLAIQWVYEMTEKPLTKMFEKDDILHLTVREMKDPFFSIHLRDLEKKPKVIILPSHFWAVEELKPALYFLFQMQRGRFVFINDEFHLGFRKSTSTPTSSAFFVFGQNKGGMIFLISGTPTVNFKSECAQYLETFHATYKGEPINPRGHTAAGMQKIFAALTLANKTPQEVGIDPLKRPPTCVSYVVVPSGTQKAVRRLSRRQRLNAALSGNGLDIWRSKKAVMAMALAKEAIKQNPGRSVAIAVNNKRGIEDMRAALSEELGSDRVVVIHGDLPPLTQEQNIRRAINEPERVIIGTVPMLQEGLNLDNVDTIIAFVMSYYKQGMEQLLARMMRWVPDPNLVKTLFILVDKDAKCDERVRELCAAKEANTNAYYTELRRSALEVVGQAPARVNYKRFEDMQPLELDQIPQFLAGTRHCLRNRLMFPGGSWQLCSGLSLQQYTTTLDQRDRGRKLCVPEKTPEQLAAERKAARQAKIDELKRQVEEGAARLVRLNSEHQEDEEPAPAVSQAVPAASEADPAVSEAVPAVSEADPAAPEAVPAAPAVPEAVPAAADATEA